MPAWPVFPGDGDGGGAVRPAPARRGWRVGAPGRGKAAAGCSQEPRDGGPARAALTGDRELPRPGWQWLRAQGPCSPSHILGTGGRTQSTCGKVRKGQQRSAACHDSPRPHAHSGACAQVDVGPGRGPAPPAPGQPRQPPLPAHPALWGGGLSRSLPAPASVSSTVKGKKKAIFPREGVNAAELSSIKC